MPGCLAICTGAPRQPSPEETRQVGPPGTVLMMVHLPSRLARTSSRLPVAVTPILTGSSRSSLDRLSSTASRSAHCGACAAAGNAAVVQTGARVREAPAAHSQASILLLHHFGVCPSFPMVT